MRYNRTQPYALNCTILHGLSRWVDLLVRVLVNYELLAPYGQHWVYDTPLFRLSLEATGTRAE